MNYEYCKQNKTMKRTRTRRRIAFFALLLSSSIHSSDQTTLRLGNVNSNVNSSVNSNENTNTNTNELSPSLPLLRNKRNLNQSSSSSTSSIIMTLYGVNPLSQSDLTWFQDQTEAYIQHYYQDDQSSCTQCLQKSIDVTDVIIQVTDQNPPFDANTMTASSSTNTNDGDGSNHNSNSDSSNMKVTLTYSQTTTYTSSKSTSPTGSTASPENDDQHSIQSEDIVKEPFNNIALRKDYRTNFLNATGAPDAFYSLSITSALSIAPPKPNSFFSSAGFIAIVATGGFALLVAFIFGFYCWSKRRSKDKIYDGDGYLPNAHDIDNAGSGSGSGSGRRHAMEHHRSDSFKRNKQHGQSPPYPSHLQVNDGIKDEVSTIMVDPPERKGVFSTEKNSVHGFNSAVESVGEHDPMYSDVYGQGSTDDLSSAGGTYGEQTQKSKFSAMESILTPGMNTAGQSTYTEDDTLFEDHMRNRRKGSSAVKEQYLDIYAPGGKLGVVIDTPNMGGPVVHNIKDTCPIADQLRVGDKLVAVDDEDVRSMTAVKVSKLISQKSNNPNRKFTILRVVDE